MGCCVSRQKLILSNQSRIPELHSTSYLLNQEMTHSFSYPKCQESVKLLDLKPIEELDDVEVWNRLLFAETVENDLTGWKDRVKENSISIKTKLFTFYNITNEVILADLNFSTKVPEDLLIDLLNKKERRIEWDKSISQMQISESNSLDPSDVVVFTRMEMMLIIKRYYVERRVIRRYKKSVVIVNYSIQLEDEIIPKGIKEGATFVNLVAGLYFIREKEEGTQLRMILMLEPLRNTTYSSITISGVKSWMNALNRKILLEISSRCTMSL